MASEYLKWKYRDVPPDAKVELTPAQKRANWWHYHKWWLLVGLIALAAGADILYNALGIGAVKPDYQVAWVASVPPEEKTLAAVRDALAALGEDCDGDGRVVVALNPYVDMAASQDSDAARYAQAAKVRLMADMEARESYFFICDAPETLHDDYQILAGPDGALAARAADVLYWPCESVPALRGLGLDGLYLARRGFWGDRTGRYQAQCDALWARLTEGARV